MHAYSFPPSHLVTPAVLAFVELTNERVFRLANNGQKQVRSVSG